MFLVALSSQVKPGKHINMNAVLKDDETDIRARVAVQSVSEYGNLGCHRSLPQLMSLYE